MSNVLNPTIAPKSIQSYSPNVNALEMALAQGTAGVQGVSGQKNAGTIGAVATAAAPVIGTLVGGPLGTLAGSGVSALGQGMTNRQNVDLANQQMQWNERMMDKQNQQTLDFWNLQNEYNTPAAQVQRMHEAGLYAGGVGANQAQSLNAASPLGYQNPNVQNPFADFSDLAIKTAQVENIKADTAAKNATTKTENELRQDKIDNLRADTNQKKSNAANLDIDSANKTILNKYLDEKEQLEIRNLEENVKLTQKQQDQIDSAIAKNKKEMEEIDQRILNLKAQETLTRTQIAECIQLIKQSEAMTEKLANESNVAKLDVMLYLFNHLKPGIGNSGLSIPNYAFDIDGLVDKLLEMGVQLPDSMRPNRGNSVSGNAIREAYAKHFE